jgi:HEAT repeat protein
VGSEYLNGGECEMYLKVLPLFAIALAILGCKGSKTSSEPRPVAELEARIRDKDPAVRSKATLEMGRHGSNAASAVPALIEALKSDDSALRQHAALSLGKIGPGAKDGVPALIEALGDSEWTVRRNAVNALGEIGDPRALPAVEARTSDPDSLVRKAAVESAKKLRNAQK